MSTQSQVETQTIIILARRATGHLMQVLIAGMLTAFQPEEPSQIPSRAGLGHLPVLLGFYVGPSVGYTSSYVQ